MQESQHEYTVSAKFRTGNTRDWPFKKLESAESFARRLRIDDDIVALKIGTRTVSPWQWQQIR